MRYLALACDYDETLATNGFVASHVIAALERLRATGRKLVLVTGRRLEDLLAAFPRADLFDRIVAENGGVLYRPDAGEEVTLATAPPSALVEALHARGVAPLEVGRVVIATWRPHESTALEVIRDMGLDWQIIFNEGAVMLLPAGVNKATGLAAALAELDLSAHNVVGVGNSANDHSLLGACECSVAVRNAIRAVREHTDFATEKSTGDGVVQLIDELVDTDLAARDSALLRHHLLLGTRESGAEVLVPPYGSSLLIAGPSGSGKSTAATAFLERLMERGYQFCIIDPEGTRISRMPLFLEMARPRQPSRKS
jgi:HAD superfamily hydrolase (TIGR01484 family)